MTILHRVTAPVVKVSIGSPGGNRVARILTRGSLVPEGVAAELLDSLTARGLIEAIEPAPEAFDHVHVGAEPTPPPKAGKGSGEDAWRTYADAVGVEVPADASRDDVIAAIETAGKPTE